MPHGSLCFSYLKVFHDFTLKLNSTSFITYLCYKLDQTLVYLLQISEEVSTVFTVLHGMQTRSSDENSVCLSVCHTRGL